MLEELLHHSLTERDAEKADLEKEALRVQAIIAADHKWLNDNDLKDRKREQQRRAAQIRR